MRPTPAVRAILGLELRTLFRDPRTLLMSVVLPVVLIPVLILGSRWLEDRRADRADERVFQVAVAGGEAQFAEELLALRGGDEEEGGVSRRFRWVEREEPVPELQSESVDLFLEALSPEEWRELVEAEEVEPEALPELYDGARVLRIHYYSTRTASREGSEALRDTLVATRETRRDSMLVHAGHPVEPERIAVLDLADVASEREIQGARLGRFLTLILLGLIVLGGSVIATDTLAGEKERGTLTTLLTSAASRSEIIQGKLLAIVTVSLGIAVVQLLNLWIFLGTGLVDPAEGFAVSVSPALAGGLFLLYLPLVALAAGVLLLTSAHANSYKEAQLYLFPVLVGIVLPGMAPLIPELTLQSAVVAVPIANLSLAARDLLVGEAQLLWVASAWLVTAGAASWVMGRSVRALQDERLVTGDTSPEEFAGGPALFPKRVLRWFVAFWALKVLLEINLPIQDLRWSILVNVGLVFLAFPLVVIWTFRLDPREALALRMPRPQVWLGVLLAVPAGLVAAQGVFQLMDRVLPVPTELLEGFGQGLLPEGIPLWQLVLLISLVPGITEELTFRGVLLHGLRRRFGPVALALVVGILFGLFHFQLFRIPSTAFLGVLLTAVTLLSGSIFPAMVWHSLNNGLAVYLSSREVPAEALGGEWVLAACLLLALAFWIFWRFRTPYPGLRPARTERPAGRRL